MFLGQLQSIAGGQGKKYPADFTVWKAAKPDEPFWDSPWGPGRPGWHIECSAMARSYVGDEFDIHGGGLDLVFPHHENERAQSHGAGLGFARYWMHSFWVTQAGEKMSKSLGNTLAVDVITRRVRPIELRYYLVSVHYRASIEYSEGALDDAAKAFARIEAFLRRVTDRYGEVQAGELPAGFVEAMDDDLGVPRAIAVIHDHVRSGNTALDADQQEVATDVAAAVRGMLAVLGLDPFAALWSGSEARSDDTEALTAALDVLVSACLTERQEARVTKDFAIADAMRDRLAAAGLAIVDGPSGSTWSLEKQSLHKHSLDKPSTTDKQEAE